jgi:hypothetical protein
MLSVHCHINKYPYLCNNQLSIHNWILRQSHLSRMIDTEFSDDLDITHQNRLTTRQINDVLSYFRKLDAIEKLFKTNVMWQFLWPSTMGPPKCKARSFVFLVASSTKNIWKLPMNRHANRPITCWLSGKHSIECEIVFHLCAYCLPTQ